MVGYVHMNITISHKPVSKTDSDTLVLFAWKVDAKSKDITYGNILDAIDTESGGIITKTACSDEFDASVGKTLVVQTQGNIPSRNVMLVGLGNQKEMSVATLQKSGAAASRRLKAIKSVHADVLLDLEISQSISRELLYQSVVEGFVLGSYEFTRHKTVDIESFHSVTSVNLVIRESETDLVSQSLSRALLTSKAVIFARDLVNEPPSLTTPEYLAQKAMEIVKGNNGMSCEVFGKSDLIKMKMGGILGIASGTDVEPKFIKLEYRGGGNKTIALIGKGITFDTGGLSLKGAGAMETMKMDMAGAAAVLGVFSAIYELRPKVNIIGLISATENMPGPNAVKPGDIVTAMNGKTIEILNTDAEGRVVLADALSYAVSEVKPDVMIDLATLTGACVVALGEEVTGLFSNTNELAKELISSAIESGESVWHMPLVDEYKDQLKSNVADVKNIGAGRWGGAITAALFLQEFTDPSIPWAHLDIAGPAFAEKDMVISTYGGTGHAVRLLLNYLTKRG